MKRNFLSATLLFLGLSTALISCNKDDVTLNNGSNMFNVKTLFEGLKSPVQTFNVTAGQPYEVNAAGGTRIMFKPTTFRDALGNVITSGIVKIELTEILKPADMIANRVFTTTVGHQILKSGGAVNIIATMDGNPVFATGGYDLGFRQDEEKNEPMALFTGITSTDSSGTAVFWSESSTNEIERTTKEDGMNEFFYAFDSVTNFNWINCDYFYSSTAPKTDINIVVPDSTYNTTNTQVFVVFKSINSVSGLWGYNAPNHVFSFGYVGYHIPVGTVIDVVVLGAKNNGYFMQVQQNLTVTNNLSINFTPQATTIAGIQAMLSTL